MWDSSLVFFGALGVLVDFFPSCLILPPHAVFLPPLYQYTCVSCDSCLYYRAFCVFGQRL